MEFIQDGTRYFITMMIFHRDMEGSHAIKK